jgi:hypothetical protein
MLSLRMGWRVQSQGEARRRGTLEHQAMRNEIGSEWVGRIDEWSRSTRDEDEDEDENEDKDEVDRRGRG